MVPDQSPPESEYNNLPVLTDLQRNLYHKSLEYKYENVFKTIYQKLIDMR